MIMIILTIRVLIRDKITNIILTIVFNFWKLCNIKIKFELVNKSNL